MIFIDLNETATSQIPNLLRAQNVPMMIIPEQGPDYIIDNMVAVERKTVGDYLNSKDTGHLDKQLYEMSYNFDISYLVIYGDMQAELINRGHTRPMYYSSLIGSSLKRAEDGKQGQIITINDTSITNDDDLAIFLLMLHKKIQERDFVRVPKLERFRASDEDYQKRLFMSFPNIGEKRAEEILTTYRTVQNALSTLIFQPDIFKVSGLSQKTVNHMNQILTKEYVKK